MSLLRRNQLGQTKMHHLIKENLEKLLTPPMDDNMKYLIANRHHYVITDVSFESKVEDKKITSKYELLIDK